MRRHVHHRKIGDDQVDNADTRERQGALRQDFEIFSAVFLFGDVLHQYDNAFDASDQVHRTAHAFDHLARNHPVGEIAFFADLHGTQNRQVDLAATDHGERLVAAKNR